MKNRDFLALLKQELIRSQAQNFPRFPARTLLWITTDPCCLPENPSAHPFPSQGIPHYPRPHWKHHGAPFPASHPRALPGFSSQIPHRVTLGPCPCLLRSQSGALITNTRQSGRRSSASLSPGESRGSPHTGGLPPTPGSHRGRAPTPQPVPPTQGPCAGVLGDCWNGEKGRPFPHPGMEEPEGQHSTEMGRGPSRGMRRRQETREARQRPRKGGSEVGVGATASPEEERGDPGGANRDRP